MNAEWLRYYIAAKLNANVEDIDFDPDDFIARVNSDLVGKYVNIASRCAVFLNRKFGGKLAAPGQRLLPEFQAKAALLAALYDQREFGKALREVMALADLANQYVDEEKPWELSKRQGSETRAAERMLPRHQPVSPAHHLPEAGAARSSPRTPSASSTCRRCDGATLPRSSPSGHSINEYRHLLGRVEEKQLDQLFDAVSTSQPAAPQRHAEKQQHQAQEQAVSDTITH